jgi:hypothetical protein
VDQDQNDTAFYGKKQIWKPNAGMQYQVENEKNYADTSG